MLNLSFLISAGYLSILLSLLSNFRFTFLFNWVFFFLRLFRFFLHQGYFADVQLFSHSFHWSWLKMSILTSIFPLILPVNGFFPPAIPLCFLGIIFSYLYFSEFNLLSGFDLPQLLVVFPNWRYSGWVGTFILTTFHFFKIFFQKYSSTDHWSKYFTWLLLLFP